MYAAFSDLAARDRDARREPAGGERRPACARRARPPRTSRLCGARRPAAGGRALSSACSHAATARAPARVVQGGSAACRVGGVEALPLRLPPAPPPPCMPPPRARASIHTSSPRGPGPVKLHGPFNQASRPSARNSKTPAHTHTRSHTHLTGATQIDTAHRPDLQATGWGGGRACRRVRNMAGGECVR